MFAFHYINWQIIVGILYYSKWPMDLHVLINVNARRQDHVLSLGFCTLKESNFGLELYVSEIQNESF